MPTPTDSVSAADLLDLARAAALDGGRAILPFVGQDLPHDVKADDSPLTQADLAAHRAIVSRLETLSTLPILSEEGDPESQDRSGWTRFWCVDPLDGTKEFIKGTGQFTVNVALIEDGRPTVGVVHVPVSGVTYAAAGGVATKEANASEPDAEPVEIRVRAATDALSVVASRDHAGPEVAAFIARAEADGRTVERASMGSSLKFCLVAEGAADVYPRTVPTFEWDTAAAQAIVEAAGGGVYTADGAPLGYNKENLRNPGVFAVGDAGLPWRSWLAR